MSALVEATEVVKHFGSGELGTRVLHGVSVSVQPGQLALLLGPSGSGKTTLISILAGLLRPSSGIVELCGARVSHLKASEVSRVRRTHLGFVFQTFNLFPALTAIDNVAEVLALRGTPIRAAREEARRALDRVGLAHRIDHRPADLSGGERQRVAIARALATSPSVLIGDEPTAALDGKTAVQIFEILRSYVGPSTCALIVTHDRRLERYADRVFELEDGRLKS